ncbi:MAG TPA: peptidoglycan-binding domain-containing protein [Verrucomicrobiae bacterium]|nr:peptidoglycan-binding domain-containing protein [Verrucomicrobiae bacterium]
MSDKNEYTQLLAGAFQRLKGAKDTSYRFIICDAKPHVGVMVAKQITAKHKEDLTKATGGKRFLASGECRFEDGHFVFIPETPVAGLARKVQAAVQFHTGKKYEIQMGSERSDDAAAGQPSDQPAAAAEASKPEPAAVSGGTLAIRASVGQGGKNSPADVSAVQNALNAKVNAGLKVDGKCDSKMIAAIQDFQKAMGMPKPDGRIDPGRGTARALSRPGPLPPAPAAPQAVEAPKLGRPELGKASSVWHNMRAVIDTNLEQVKKAATAHYAHEDPNLAREVQQNLGKLDGIKGKFDHRIADSLAKAHAAKDEASRKAELKKAKGILAEYINHVKSEPLIAHVDSNPWLKINLRKTLVDTITHMAQAIG